MIVVCGMLGVGKTTYVSMMEEYLASQAFYESVDDNPILSKFYAEPEKYAFMSQIYFLSTRYAAARKASAYPRFLLDRSIYEDVLFAQVNHDLGRITAEEKVVYDTLATGLIEEVEAMDTKNMYIYLKSDFDTVQQRIAQRSRSYEQDPKNREYYKALHLRYDDWMQEHVNPAELLVIDTQKYDVFNPEDKQAVLKEIVLKMQSLGL